MKNEKYYSFSNNISAQNVIPCKKYFIIAMILAALYNRRNTPKMKRTTVFGLIIHGYMVVRHPSGLV